MHLSHNHRKSAKHQVVYLHALWKPVARVKNNAFIFYSAVIPELPTRINKASNKKTNHANPGNIRVRTNPKQCVTNICSEALPSNIMTPRIELGLRVVKSQKFWYATWSTIPTKWREIWLDDGQTHRQTGPSNNCWSANRRLPIVPLKMCKILLFSVIVNAFL